MKRLTCEMCGGTDLIKDGGVFVCQTCGCKYSVEEARRMMIEGTVDVSGSTIKVDNTAFVEKYLANARRAKEKEDWDEVEKYYNMVEQNDPDNIEAIFYSAYGKAKRTLVESDIYKRQAAFKVLKNSISVIDDHYKPERRKENDKAINEIALSIINMMASSFVYNRKVGQYGVEMGSDKNQTYSLFLELPTAFAESMSNIAEVDDHAYLHDVMSRFYAMGSTLDYIWEKSAWKKVSKLEYDKFVVLKNYENTQYWNAHPDQKAELDGEIDVIKTKIEGLEQKKKEIEEPYNDNIKEKKEEIKALNEERGKLGYFKMKESKALHEKITEIQKTIIPKIEEEMKIACEEVNQEIEDCKKQIKQIEEKLDSAYKR